MTYLMPVTFVAGGTRGDIQPYIVLARALMRRGIPAQIAASRRWQSFVVRTGVPYYELPADPVELLLQPQYQHALTMSLHGIQASVHYLRAMRPYVDALCRALPHLQQHSRALVVGVASQWVVQPMVVRSIPVIWGLLQPLVPTHDFASPMLNCALPRRMNRWSHKLVNRFMWLSWQMHGLPAYGGLTRIATQPAFVACSRTIVPAWSDMISHHAVTGWLGQLNEPVQVQPSLDSFMAQKAPYVVAAFGTPAANETDDLYKKVIAATQQLGVRLLLQVPTRFAGMSVPTGVYVIADDVDHRTVFARATTVIHHGGAGTTHACIDAGVPMIVVPRGIDQFYWAQRVYACGLTPLLLSRSRLTVNQLVIALNATLHQSQYRIRAQECMIQLQNESAVDDALRHLYAHINLSD